MVCGVILAAGQSSRMGRSKALLLTADGESFVARLGRVLLTGGVTRVLVVGRADDQPLRATVMGMASAAFVENPDAEQGQLSSVVAGIDAADALGAASIVMMPVDVPLAGASAVTALIAAWRNSGAPIARAVHDGRHGHPVLFDRALFDELRRADPAVGARAVVRAHDVLDVEVGDPGVLEDVDTPDDYRRITGGQ